MRLERAFEWILWNSRVAVIVAVVASLLVGFGALWVSTVDAFTLLAHMTHYHEASASGIAEAGIAGQDALRSTIVAHVVAVVDGYLLAAIMLIFALGLYELFVSRIDVAEGSEFASRVLLIRSLDDLKDRLAKVVLLMLVVKFFEIAIGVKIERPLDLLYLAVGIALVSTALWLSHGGPAKPKLADH
jgi:uncharacterized membrane protein YqhA